MVSSLFPPPRSALQTVAGGVLGAVAGFGAVSRSQAAQTPLAALPDDAYTTLGGDMKSCRVLNGEESPLVMIATGTW